MRLIRDAVASSVDVPSSGRLMTGRLVAWFLAGLQIRSYTSRARLDVQQHCTVCERFPTCRHAVVAQIHEVIARVCSVFDRNPIDRHTADMLSAT